METTKKLSIIIVNYKSEHYLEICLSALYRAISDQVSFEVIIVNNYPEEKLEDIRKIFPKTQVIVNSKNGGFGQGNNVGVRSAFGEYILLLNPDTEILSFDPLKALEEFEKNPNLGALGGCLITEEKKIQPWSTGAEVNFWDLVRNNLGSPPSQKIWESRGKREVAWVAGTAFLVPRQLYMKVGGFDENIFMYFEDVDLCERIKKEGKKILYFPEFKIMHKCGGSYTEEGKRWQKKNYYDSMEYYFKKHRPKIESMAVNFLRKIFFSQ